ncbi:MAG: hypothetical protein PHT91_00315 [Candidatus Nanoarchaeia archaeon]|nr:hypothetical protein [Candidatus Nanoarchaeia archaeon]MDD5053947.1 hypothetical protein [Candidatus Nanoarchaeia archaeon]MDD5499304.1 hypothetical protein [Candidatus Nanoarchaeia archaeon]
MMKARFIIQAMGSPKELLEKTAKTMLDSIKKNFKTEDEHIEKPVKSGKEFYASFIETTISFKNLEEFFSFMINYSPTSAEIIEPYKFELSAGELENFSNDFLGKLHEIDKQLKTQLSLNKILSRRVIRSNTKEKL